MNTNVKAFILENWDKTVRTNTVDAGSLIGLPKPYTVPCIEGFFQEMYYWDTYFTNIGLLLSGKVEQAINNTENIAYLIERYGKMPNGSRTFYLNRSQPPFFSQAVRDIFEATGDLEWLSRMYSTAEKEYSFWCKNRITESGLNRYYCDGRDGFGLGAAEYLCERCGLDKPDEANIEDYSKCLMSFCESGWDCTSRFDMRAHEFNALDLNSLLYGMEKNMEYFSGLLKNGESDAWLARAEKRKLLMNRLMWNTEEEAFYDYDLKEQKVSDFFSAASFYPLAFGLATNEQAEKTVAHLPKIEMQYGVAGCEERSDNRHLQWDYPNGWGCLQYIVIKGLLNYGYKSDALRIAGKYASLVESNFEKTGTLWEKYNVVTGGVSTAAEYETPTMLGWSAGIYLYVLKLCLSE